MNLKVSVIMLKVGCLKSSGHLRGLWNLRMGHQRSIHVSCPTFRDSP